MEAPRLDPVAIGSVPSLFMVVTTVARTVGVSDGWLEGGRMLDASTLTLVEMGDGACGSGIGLSNYDYIIFFTIM
jgi:hypothetical protein